MAVASKSSVSTRKRQIPSRARAVAALNPKDKPLAMSEKGLTKPIRPGKTVPILPNSQSSPLWLLRLSTWQHRSSVATFLLVVATLIIYGWTVYSQQMWSQSYRKLLTLQRDERQLTTTNEVLKNNMAQQAEDQAMGLVPPNPATTIFLSSAQERSTAAVPASKRSAETQQNRIPLGY